MRVLVAGIGYHNLRDLSIGPELVADLQREPWPDGVEIDDLSYSPIEVLYRLSESMPPYDRVVLIGGVQRGRSPGAITRYHWDGALPDDAEVQSRVVEAISGVVSLENLLIITRFFGSLPDDVVVVEIEPGDTDWGEGFSPRVRAVISEIKRVVQHEALADSGSRVAMRGGLGERVDPGEH